MKKTKFREVTKDKVLEAIKKYDNMSEDERKRYGKISRTYFLLHYNSKYPPKVIIRIALNKTTKDLEKENFDFNAIEAETYLDNLGFEIEGERKHRDKVATFIKTLEKEEVTFYEGKKYERTYLKSQRNINVVRKLKEAKNYTCEVCNFHFNKRIVEVHHLTPFSETEGERKVTPEDLIVLCPNCHSIAHYLLKQDKKYEQRKTLVEEIKRINHSF